MKFNDLLKALSSTLSDRYADNPKGFRGTSRASLNVVETVDAYERAHGSLLQCQASRVMVLTGKFGLDITLTRRPCSASPAWCKHFHVWEDR